MSEFCPKCEDYRESETKTVRETFKVRGIEIEVSIPKQICVSCGENIGSDEQDQQILDVVYAEYRKRTDLLTPEKIKGIREKYNLSQKSFALLLGMSEATVNRYEKGALQDQAHDAAIRACEDTSFFRQLFERKGHLLSQWQRDRVQKTLAGQDTSMLLPFCCLGAAMPSEVSEQTGFRRFDYDRFAYVVAYLCSEMGEISTTVINKLLFYADFLNYKISTVSLTGAAYRKLDYGPVPADYNGLLSKMESEGLVERAEKLYPNGYVGQLYRKGIACDSIQVELTKHEKKVLDFVAGKFKNYTAKQISEISHKESAWINTPDKKLISYMEAVNLSLDIPEE